MTTTPRTGATAAREDAITDHAPAETAHGAAEMGEGEQPSGLDRREPERIPQGEHEVREHAGLKQREREPADEDHDHAGTSEERSDVGESSGRGSRRDGARRRFAIEERDGHGREDRDHAGGPQGDPPAERDRQ